MSEPKATPPVKDAETNPVKDPKGHASDFVVVGCKLPNGIVLNLDSYEQIGPADRGQVRRVPGKLGPVTLQGWAHARDRAPHQTMAGGYAFTAVPRAFWDEWLARNGETSELLADGLIIHGKTADAAKGLGLERAATPMAFAPARPGDVPGVEMAVENGKPIIAHNAEALKAA